MTRNKQFKREIRKRKSKTGESYSVARITLLQQKSAGSTTDRPSKSPVEPLRPSSGPSDLVPFEFDLDLDESPVNSIHSEVESPSTPASENDDSFSDEDEEYPPPWEEDAREAVELALAAASFELEDEEGVVRMPDSHDGSKHPQPVECWSINELRDELMERAETAWCGSVPWEGGPVFEPDCENIVDDALSKYRERLSELGWEL